MPKVYCASPFFNELEVTVRDAMCAAMGRKWSDLSIFRPDLTETSKSYEKSPGDELGKIIFDENVEHITKSDVLCFPLGTKDMGTLWEVGVAIRLGKEIYGYKWKPEDELRRIDPSKYDIPTFTGPSLIQIETLSSAVVMGYNFDSSWASYYVLGEGVRDNLMLRFMGQRVSFHSKGKFRTEHVDIKEVQ